MPQQEDNVDFYTTMNCTNHYQHSTLPKPVDPISQISTREVFYWIYLFYLTPFHFIGLTHLPNLFLCLECLDQQST